MRTLRTCLPVLLSLCLASAAWAATEEELTDQAQVLLADYQALETDVDACPNGDCEERSELEERLDDLEARRLQLHSDRASLGQCGCQTLDALIADIDATASVLRSTVGGWDDQG